MSSVSRDTVRSVLVAAGGSIALIAAFTLGSAGQGGGKASATAEQPDPAPTGRRIAMRGVGESTGVPDQMSFKLSVDIKAADVSVALDRASARMRRVLRALNTQGVARKDVATTGLQIQPVYDYSDNGPTLITGYSVSEDAGVLIRSLDDAGSVVGAAVDAGGNAVRLHGLRLQIGDEEALLRQARDSAVAQATTKARQYAEATGQDLGDVISIKEVVGRNSGPVASFDTRAAFDTVSKVPIRAGSADLSVTVAVEWQLA